MQRSLFLTIGTIASMLLSTPAIAESCYCNLYSSDGACSDMVCTSNDYFYNNRSSSSDYKRYTNRSSNYNSSNYYNSYDNADINISITDSPDPVSVGDTITYRIRLRNREDFDVRTDVRAYLDSKTTFVSASEDGEDIDSDEVEWTRIDLDADDTTTLTLRVRVRSNTSSNGSVRLRVETDDDDATITTQVNGYNNGNNSSSVICNYYNSYLNTYYSDYCDSRHASPQHYYQY